MKGKVLFVFMSFLLIDVSCQTSHQSYLDVLKTKCANPDITEIEKKSGYVEIEYLCEGKVYEIILDDHNTVISYEAEATEMQLPEQVMKKLARNYPGWQVDEHSVVYFNDTSIMKIEIVKDGIEQNVYFTLTGKLYKPRSFHEAQQWTSTLLKDNSRYKALGFDLFNPAVTYELPDVLNEISGIAVVDSNQILCVQDELGSVFKYDLVREAISRSYRFSDVGDYEDVTCHNGKIFVLRSDGTVSTFSSADFPADIQHQIFSFQSLNLEGIYFDNASSSLYFACNESNVNAEENRKEIYSYDLKKQKRLKSEISIHADTIAQILQKRFPELAGNMIDFSPSAITVHPNTGDFYIISASDRIMVIYDQKRNLRGVYPLPSDYFFKPEGIAFLPNGNMLISNEGTKNGLVKANILMFEHRGVNARRDKGQACLPARQGTRFMQCTLFIAPDLPDGRQVLVRGKANQPIKNQPINQYYER